MNFHAWHVQNLLSANKRLQLANLNNICSLARKRRESSTRIFFELQSAACKHSFNMQCHTLSKTSFRELKCIFVTKSDHDILDCYCTPSTEMISLFPTSQMIHIGLTRQQTGTFLKQVYLSQYFDRKSPFFVRHRHAIKIELEQ